MRSILFVLSLSLYFTPAFAGGKDKHWEARADRPTNGSVIGRPTTSVDCNGVTISSERVHAEDALEFARICGGTEVAKVRVQVTQTDADTRRLVATSALEKGSSMYADGDKIAVGQAAVYAAGYGQFGTGDPFGMARGLTTVYAAQAALMGPVMQAPDMRDPPATAPSSTTAPPPAATATDDKEAKATARVEALEAQILTESAPDPTVQKPAP